MALFKETTEEGKKLATLLEADKSRLFDDEKFFTKQQRRAMQDQIKKLEQQAVDFLFFHERVAIQYAVNKRPAADLITPVNP